MYIITKILCFFGIHNWEISKWCIYEHKKSGRIHQLVEEGFNRTCLRCGKIQQLQKPDKYDPVAYIWKDLKK